MAENGGAFNVPCVRYVGTAPRGRPPRWRVAAVNRRAATGDRPYIPWQAPPVHPAASRRLPVAAGDQKDDEDWRTGT